MPANNIKNYFELKKIVIIEEFYSNYCIYELHFSIFFFFLHHITDPDINVSIGHVLKYIFSV